MKLKSAAIKAFMFLFGRNPWLNDKNFSEILYFMVFGKKPNLEDPKTFNEHICAIRLSEKCYSYAPYVDKYEVRKYVEATVGFQYLNPLIGIYESEESIPFDQLPESFAIKCTHASGYNIIVADKSKLDVDRAKKKLRKWLRSNYYWVNRERNYKNIYPRILIDKFIPFTRELREFKLFCFRGEVKFISVNVFADGKRKVAVYDPEWHYIPVSMGYPNTGDVLERPQNLDELVDVATALAKPFEFVRVDMYNNNGKILFSELTFTSGGGLVRIWPEVYSEEWGSYFKEKL